MNEQIGLICIIDFQYFTKHESSIFKMKWQVQIQVRLLLN